MLGEAWWLDRLLLAPTKTCLPVLIVAWAFLISECPSKEKRRFFHFPNPLSFTLGSCSILKAKSSVGQSPFEVFYNIWPKLLLTYCCSACLPFPAFLSIKISLNFNYSQVPIWARWPTNEVQIFVAFLIFFGPNSRSKPEPEHFMLMTNAFISTRTKRAKKKRRMKNGKL